jgi:hypothetical protein
MGWLLIHFVESSKPVHMGKLERNEMNSELALWGWLLIDFFR